MCRMIVVIALSANCLLVTPSVGQTPLGTAFNFQGQLKQGGVPLSGTADFQFTLWDAAGSGNPPAGGTQVGGVQAINAQPVTAGLFNVTLNGGGAFGANAFNGNARWLQIAVRSPAGGGSFTTLTPRQPLTATPNALFALNAARLGGVAASEYVTTTNAGNTFIANNTALQSTSNFNISGNGTAGSLKINGEASLGGITPPATAPAGQGRIYFDSASNKVKISENSGAFVNLVGASGVGGSGTPNSIPFWSAGTTLGTSQITQSANGVQLPNGVQLAAGAQGNQVNFGSPNGETGMSIHGPTGIAHVRFDGTSLKLFAGPAGSPPSNGIVINTSGGATITGTNGDGAVLTARRSGGDPFVVIDAAPASQNSVLAFRKNNFNRWLMFANGSPESGGNAGSDFQLDAYNDAGLGIANHLFVKRATGNVGIGTPTPSTYNHGGTNKIVEIQNPAGAVNSQAHAILSTGSTGAGSSIGSVTWAVPNTAGAEKRAALVASNIEGSAASSVTSSLTFWTTNAGAIGQRMKITPEGNVTQPITSNGLVKAMIRVDPFLPAAQYITRCYNGITNSSTGNCGFTVTRSSPGNYSVDFGFPINNRFFSVTPGTSRLTASISAPSFNSAFVILYNPLFNANEDGIFHIIIY